MAENGSRAIWNSRKRKPSNGVCFFICDVGESITACKNKRAEPACGRQGAYTDYPYTSFKSRFSSKYNKTPGKRGYVLKLKALTFNLAFSN